MSGRRARLRLSLRITLSFAVGALLVSSVVALSAYFLTVHFLINQQNRDVLRQTYVNAATVKERLSGPNSNVPDVVDSLAVSASVQTVIYRTGRWYSSSLSVSRNSLPPNLRAGVLHGSVERLWTRINGAPQVVVGVPLPSTGGAFFEVFDESSLSRTLSILRAVLVSAAAMTTLAGAALGIWLSARITRPLRAVTAASIMIGAGDLNAHLSDERDADLTGLVTTFNAMVDSLRERIERDARFAANVSHELRSPLTTLKTSLSVLERRRDELSDRGQGALTLLAGELTRFERLVTDLLEISRSDAGVSTLELEPIGLGQLLLNVVEESEYRDIAVDIDAAALAKTVMGDKRRLEQAIRNLLDNARIHGGGPTRLSVESVGRSMQISIEDDGPGVLDEDKVRIFDRFARGRHVPRGGSGGGSGLGLALVAEHVSAHRGRVWAENRLEGGARFVIELPVSPT